MISGYLLLFLVPMTGQPPAASLLLGLVMVVLGIMLFIEGFMSGIMPLAELLGKGIPKEFSLCGAMLTTLLLGIVCTLAEPAMGALEIAGGRIQVDQAPVLWYLLNAWNLQVFLAVSLGVGLAALVGTLRMLRGWNLKSLIYSSSLATVLLTVLVDHIGLAEIVGLAWDTGAVTTGAVTVPTILGLGIGIMSTHRNISNTAEISMLDSFGIVTLASLYPILCVLLLGIICDAMVSKDDVKEYAAMLLDSGNTVTSNIWNASPIQEILYATRAVVPLIAFIVILIKVFLKKPLPYVQINIKEKTFRSPGEDIDHPVASQDSRAGSIQLHCMLGISEAYLGLTLFNFGLRYGQGPLGDQVGASVPALYSRLEVITHSPVIEHRPLGISAAAAFAFFMALTATFAEPALNAMGLTTEYLTEGKFKKSLLLLAVAIGVGAGVMFGVMRMVLSWSLTYMLLASYAVALLLTHFSSIEYVAVAWDSAGVTTSSITVPLVLSMGIGLGAELGVQDSFGLLALGSVGPIISVLIAGLLVRCFSREGALESQCTTDVSESSASSGEVVSDESC
eukprot:TRINITY_DN94505_c0_g1_i1.p1 TRINITY_DN94505_c0_g1~~TRINITY_DN94505_c0_g1_i1.p1  ORF type:complete len:617 (-),score=103.32 TRINITY_DN94505_c0_g1_i1:441-2132(-)